MSGGSETARPWLGPSGPGIEEAKALYHRLVLVVAPANSGKAAALRTLKDALPAPLVNVNLELSYRMLDLTERQ